MLTYRTGAAGSPSAAKAMSEHLLQQTLSPEMAAMAEYYAQGMSPPTPAAAAAARYAAETSMGKLPTGSQLDDIVAREIDRLAESAADPVGAPIDRNDLVARAVGAFVAADLVEEAEGLAAIRRAGAGAALSDDALRARLDIEAQRARTAKDYSSATATPRRDMNPALARRLGIDMGRAMTSTEVANLLNGQRTDGTDIDRKQKRSATEAIGRLFGMTEDEIPTRQQLEHVLAGRTVDGTPLAPEDAKHAVPRFRTVLGAKGKELTPEQRENILSGHTAAGAVLTIEQYHERMDTGRARIGYVDFTFSAPKSVSVAWAFAPTEGERAIIAQAHHDAIDSVMAEIEVRIGRARKGDGGKDGWEPGSIAWVSFDHYTARPTVGIPRMDEEGRRFTELLTLKAPSGRVAGDMQLHTHIAVMNAALTDSGRVGGLDLAQLEGRIKEWGALYQAFLGSNLRRHGVDVVLDDRTEMARLTSVPERVTEHFSKRTLSGTAAARAYAAAHGLNWDSLEPARKIGLLKQGVQDPRGAKSDDLGDMAAWRRAAAEIDYNHRSILQPDARRVESSTEHRMETAYQAALDVFESELHRRASVDGADARLAAAKGLIASGITDVAEVNDITRSFRERGVRQDGQSTSLIWGMVAGTQGQPRIAITTALHETQEKILVARARAAGTDRSAALTSAHITAAVARFPELDFQSEHGRAQRDIMDRLGTGGRLSVAIGVAGSGKSTLLKPLVEAWTKDGRDLHGIALAWRQSDDLAETGISGETTRAVDPFLSRLKRGILNLDRKSVVVIDEIGLLGTRQLNDILAAQERHGFQIVAIGDPKQMQSVEAGAVIDLLRKGLGNDAIPVLETSVRQTEQKERETVLMFRNGQTDEAVARKLADGTLQMVPGGYDEAVAAVVDLWQQRREANADRPSFNLSISTPTNYDAHRISMAIREKRRALGELGQDETIVAATSGGGRDGRTYDMPLAIGDRVRLFERTNARFLDNGGHGNIGKNGSVLEVVAIRDDGAVLRTQTGREGLVQWETLRSKVNGRIMLAYGDVLTTHTSQGTTVTEHIFAIPAGSCSVSAFSAYTSGSRHRERSFIVTSEGAERAEVAGRRPLGDRRETRESDVIKNIVRNFARQPIKENALDLLQRVESQRRGSVRQLQATKQSLQRREVEGKKPAMMAAGFAAHRAAKAAVGSTGRIIATASARRSAAQRIHDFAVELSRVVRVAVRHVSALREKQSHVVQNRSGRRAGL